MISQHILKDRAAALAKRFSTTKREIGNTQPFWTEIFNLFDIDLRQTTAQFEYPLDGKRMDLFWPGKLLVEQKSAGSDLNKAVKQAYEIYLPKLAPEVRPDHLIVCDFQNFVLEDLRPGNHSIETFTLAELPEKIGKLSFIEKTQRIGVGGQLSVTVDVAKSLASFRTELLNHGYDGKDLELFLMRLVFCLFADDTGIFSDGLFEHYIARETSGDGSDLGLKLCDLFDALNTPNEDTDTGTQILSRRPKNLDPSLQAFPYLAGSLFSSKIKVPVCSKTMRNTLLDAASYNWGDVNPAIFGSLFESVMNGTERRELGAHYTHYEDILKVINPLFMDKLYAEFDELKLNISHDRERKLQDFRKKLKGIKVMDPACGCGNFLVVTYLELRYLELEVIRILKRYEESRKNSSLIPSIVDVDQFYGIELMPHAAMIARTAMFMADHVMNVKVSEAFGKTYQRIPITKEPDIHCADALELPWENVLFADELSYIIGNPPFIGRRYRDKKQGEQIAKAFGRKNGGNLDYVTAWFAKAANYINGYDVPFAFVSTNSICQGSQVEQLWPYLLDEHDLEIAFAYKSFPWPGLANVHVIITGLEKKKYARQPKKLFDGDTVVECSEISPYLKAGPWMRVEKASKPLFGQPEIAAGVQPVDSDRYVLDLSKKQTLLSKHPDLSPYIFHWVSGGDYLNNRKREVIRLDNAPTQLKARYAKYQIPFTGNPTLPTGTFLVIPTTSSENREYFPISLFDSPAIPYRSVYFIDKATLADFALLQTKLHTIWAKEFAGKLKGDIRYSNTYCYNTFPFPVLTKDQEKELTKLGQAILDARDPNLTLAEQYDPDTMATVNPDLYKAHKANDKYVLKLYGLRVNATDGDILDKLYSEYKRRKPK